MADITSSSRIRMIEHYVEGFRSTVASYDALLIVRVLATGAEGAFTWIVNGTRHTVCEGDFLFLTPFDLRMPVLRLQGENVRIRTVVFHPDPAEADISLFNLYSAVARMPIVPAADAAPFLPDYDRLCREVRSPLPYAGNAAEAALRLFLVDFMRLSLKDDPSEPNARQNVKLSHAKLLTEVNTYLREHLSENLTIGETAAHFYVSESFLSKLFRRMVGLTFPEYVRRLRVNRVIDIVYYEKTSVLSAAQEAGFKSVSGFYKSFSAITGTSPGVFLSIGKNAEK